VHLSELVNMTYIYIMRFSLTGDFQSYMNERHGGMVFLMVCGVFGLVLLLMWCGAAMLAFVEVGALGVERFELIVDFVCDVVAWSKGLCHFVMEIVPSEV
jgi:hypothetical protein